LGVSILPNSGQRFIDVVITGLAHLDAPVVVTSAEIEDQLAPAMARMGVRPGLLAGLVGVQERRFWEPGELPSASAARAGELALERSGLDRAEIGALVNTSVSRDYVEPSTASIVHGRLGLPAAAVNFDIGNACLGFLNGMNYVSALIERGEITHGLVVNGETSRFVIESTIARLQGSSDVAMFREQFATLTCGSGAVAMVLSRRDAVDGGHAYLGGLSRSATEYALLCTGQWHEMKTDTAGLLEAGLEVGALTWKEAADTFGWDAGGFDLYALHQVSLVHTKAMCDRFGLDFAKFPLIFPMFGNMGPASVPTVVSKAADEGRLAPGDRVALMGIGSGINAMAAEIVW
jgi:3-oxoacyl-[acyl-carrier-protein] synthase III